MRNLIAALCLVLWGFSQSAIAEDEHDALLALVNHSHQSIAIMIYRWYGLGPHQKTDPLANALLRAQQRGVHVQMLFNRNQPLDESRFQRRESAEQKAWCHQHHITCTWSSLRFCHTHAKMIIVDQHQAIIMTGNLPWSSGSDGAINHLLLIQKQKSVKYLQQLFETDIHNAWQQTQRTPQPIPQSLLISPVNSEQQWLRSIQEAKESIWIEQPFLDARHQVPRNIQEALRTALKRGVTIHLLTSLQQERLNPSFQPLQQSPHFAVRSLNQQFIHSKTMLIDGHSLLLGSVNWSLSSLHCNREISVITHQAKAIHNWQRQFNTLWQEAQSI